MLFISLFVIFAVIFLIAFQHIFSVSKSPGKEKIPGARPSNSRDGNKPDIAAAGNIHDYLLDLHGKYGPLASFWYGPKYVVSIASPELFMEHHVRMTSNRPPDMMEMLGILFGSNAIQFAKTDDAIRRRELYDHTLRHETLTHFYPTFNKVARETVQALSAIPEGTRIPLVHHCIDMSIKGIVRTCFGDYFKTEEAVDHLREVWTACWNELELLQIKGPPKPGSKRDKTFKKDLASIKTLGPKMIQHRRDNPCFLEYQTFIDALLEDELPEEQMHDDCVGFLIGGLQTVGIWTFWALYFLATSPDCQEKLYLNVIEAVGQGDVEDMNHEDLRYVGQVIKETLRLSVLSTYTCRYHDDDFELAGHVLKAGTTTVHAIGVVMEDPVLWPDPSKFDPERFDIHRMTARQKRAFKPFGFAGQRTCPGQHFAKLEAAVFLAVLCRAFKFRLVKGQSVKKNYGLITRPDCEVWVTLEKRK